MRASEMTELLAILSGFFNRWSQAVLLSRKWQRIQAPDSSSGNKRASSYSWIAFSTISGFQLNFKKNRGTTLMSLIYPRRIKNSTILTAATLLSSSGIQPTRRLNLSSGSKLLVLTSFKTTYERCSKKCSSIFNLFISIKPAVLKRRRNLERTQQQCIRSSLPCSESLNSNLNGGSAQAGSFVKILESKLAFVDSSGDAKSYCRRYWLWS